MASYDIDGMNIGADSFNFTGKVVKDSGNGNNISFAYSKAGLGSTNWLAGWNGYELRAISPANIKAGSASSADKVEWNNVANKPGTFPPSAHNHDGRYAYINSADGIKTSTGDGKYNYFIIATIKITAVYVNRPITFEISGRGIPTSLVEVMFANDSSADPALSYIRTNNYTEYWIVKTATSTWQVYGKYSETWGLATIHRIFGAGANIGLTVNMTNTDAVPSGATKASYGGNVNYANSAGTASNASKVNNHTVNSDVPANAKFTDTDTHKTWGLSISGHTVSIVDGGTNKSVTVPDNNTTYDLSPYMRSADYPEASEAEAKSCVTGVF